MLAPFVFQQYASHIPLTFGVHPTDLCAISEFLIIYPRTRRTSSLVLKTPIIFPHASSTVHFAFILLDFFLETVASESSKGRVLGNYLPR